MLLHSFLYLEYLKLDHCYLFPMSLPELFISSHGGERLSHDPSVSSAAFSFPAADGIVNTKFTDMAQVTNATRNIEILRERSSYNNKRNLGGDCIRPTAQDNNQGGYDKKGFDGRGYDRQKWQQYFKSFGDPSRHDNRVTGLVSLWFGPGHLLAMGCLKNGGNGA
ncbi:hypothetical protein Tco_0371030 [Tanacetum coccineum]